MAMDKQKRLVTLLSKRTIAGLLDWKETINPDTFQLSLANKTVRIRKTRSREEPNDDFQVELLNSEGQVVDAFTDDELMNSPDDPDGEREWYNTLRALFDMVRRTALGSEKILSEVIKELEGDSQV